MNIPFVDLRAQYESIRTQLDLHIKDAFNAFQFCRGQEVQQFEEAFARVLQVKHCIACGNGTDALFLALKALGIKDHDEVITPAFSWISSAEVVSLCGARPVFADVDAETYTIDPQEVAIRITERTKAVIAVHLYGQMAEMNELRKLCDKHGLSLIEDCAQAHLSAMRGKYAGTWGDVAAFSFYPTKNLGAYGDAGSVVTSRSELQEKIRRMANHGALQKDDHLIEGVNSRMDTIQAAVLLAKLPYLDQWNKQRQANAGLYTALLAGIPEIVLPAVRKNSDHTFHLYVIRAERRDTLRMFLQQHGVQTMIHYPKALVNLAPYQEANSGGDFPVSNKLENEVLSLPVYPELQPEAIAYVAGKIKAFYNS